MMQHNVDTVAGSMGVHKNAQYLTQYLKRGTAVAEQMR